MTISMKTSSAVSNPDPSVRRVNDRDVWPGFENSKITDSHRERLAVVYVRQSTQRQVLENREGNSVPLRADLANDLREWLSDRLTSRRDADRKTTPSFETEAARVRDTPDSNVEDARLSMDESLFNVPSSILRVLDRDLKAAGISKRDRGRTLDVHALRHTFGTHLSKAGVPLRTAQAAMRHSSPTLTANIYTDSRLLDVQGAVEALPAFGPASPDRKREQTASTGTHDQSEPRLPLLLPPAPASHVHSESSSGNLEKIRGQAFASQQSQKTV